jgi:unsaturated rhamnogalacturonyl hydrolase
VSKPINLLSKRPAKHLRGGSLLARVLLCVACGLLTAAALPASAKGPDGSPQMVTALYLPHLQRSVAPHPEAGLLLQIGEAGFAGVGDDCGWEGGTLATGWAQMWVRTGDEQYWRWLADFVDGCLARGATISHVNDLPLAYAAAVLHRRFPQPEYQALTSAGAHYVFDLAPRTPDGALIHLDNMVWDDTLFVVIPFLLEMWEITAERRFLDEAVRQVQLHALHLQDGTQGLYRHAWSAPLDAYTGPSFWGRGNGWVLWAQSRVLSVLPVSFPEVGALLAAYRAQAAALVARQAQDGMWHTVVTRSDFYVETSATALIAAGLSTGAANGWLGPDAAPAAAAGQAAVWRQVAAPGVPGSVAGAVGNVSGPTGPMMQEEAYKLIPLEPFTLYGQGCALILGAAVPVP